MSVKSEFVLGRSLSFSEPGLLLVGGTEIDEYTCMVLTFVKKGKKFGLQQSFTSCSFPFPGNTFLKGLLSIVLVMLCN